MASITTLVSDIYGLLEKGEAKVDTDSLSKRLQERLSEERGPPTLRMSNFATPDKHLWFHINKPELAIPMEPWVKNKLMYGDIIEEYILELARQSGHKVEHEQEEVEYAGIKGHIDCTIDGVVVDVKSANSRSFEKFRKHQLEHDDPFGYLDQLSLYCTCLRSSVGAFLAIDKELGHICLDTYNKKDVNYQYEAGRKLRMLSQPNPPSYCCDPVPHGTSGNMQLPVRCRYNPYKFACHPGLRVFKYSAGPVFLTRVVKTPDVDEITYQYSKYKHV